MINTCHCERSEAIQPIYIDGVDVSKCKFYSEKLECRNGSGFIQVANGCGFCTHNIRGLDDADVYVQTFARCLNNECYYKELKARGRMIEDLLNNIPLTITKFIDVDCPYCHNKHQKRIEYDFKINLLQIDNKKRYQMYYETSQIFSGTNEKYIGRATGTGYLTLEDAFNELQAIIKEQTNEK